MKRRNRKPGLLVRRVEAISPTEVRVFFSDGSVVERRLPGVKKIGRVRVVDEGLGIDLGDGKGEFSAYMLAQPCKGRRVYSML
jgi:hypothetical protein